jgi:hypothetical protein
MFVSHHRDCAADQHMRALNTYQVQCTVRTGVLLVLHFEVPHQRLEQEEQEVEKGA